MLLCVEALQATRWPCVTWLQVQPWRATGRLSDVCYSTQITMATRWKIMWQRLCRRPVSLTQVHVWQAEVILMQCFCLITKTSSQTDLWALSSLIVYCITFCLVLSQSACTVVQYCCNGRSKRYRKWPISGCCRRETPRPIYIKFGVGDYVGEATQYAKWHVNRFMGVTFTKGWNVNALCFLFVL